MILQYKLGESISCPANLERGMEWILYLATHNFSLLIKHPLCKLMLYFDSRVRNEPNASLLALGDYARVTYPAALQRCKFDTPLLAAGLLIIYRA